MKSFKKHKRTAALLLALTLALLPATAFAAPGVNVEASKTAVRAGDELEVIITVSGKGMSVAEGVFTYDPSLLRFEEGKGGASDGLLNLISAQKGGADSLTARVRFTALAAGNAEVSATIENVTGYDGKTEAGATAKTALFITAPTPTPTPVPIDYAQKGVLASNVKDAADNLYIWRSLENVTVPSRYSEVEFTYHGETVAAAQVKDSDAPTLLYLSNAAGDQGGYYIYDEAADALYQYKALSTVSKTYILLEPDGTVPLPAGFAETVLSIDDKEYKAWKSSEGDVYLLYARNPDGEVGYYAYTLKDQSFQRYAVMPARPAQPTLPPEAGATPVPEAVESPAPKVPGKITLSSVLFYVLCAVGGLSLLLLIGLLAARVAEDKRRRRYAAKRRAEREIARRREIGH